MPHEYEGFRSQIAAINEAVLNLERKKITDAYPGRTVLSQKDVAALEGKKDVRSVKDKYIFVDGEISVEAYARALCRRFQQSCYPK